MALEFIHMDDTVLYKTLNSVALFKKILGGMIISALLMAALTPSVGPDIVEMELKPLLNPDYYRIIFQERWNEVKRMEFRNHYLIDFVIFPFFYSTFLMILASWELSEYNLELKKEDKIMAKRYYVHVGSIAMAGVFDVFENATQLYLLWNLPQSFAYYGAIRLTSVCALIKFLLLGIHISILLYLFGKRKLFSNKKRKTA